MNIDELARQNERAYPDYVLADWYEAALPSFELYLRVQVLASEELPLVAQFVLRTMSAGLGSLDEVTGALGLRREIVVSHLAELEGRGCTVMSHDGGEGVKLSLTSMGRQVAESLAMEVPLEEDFAICIDAITGVYYSHRRLSPGKLVRGEEYHVVPAFMSCPEESGLEVQALQRLWRESRRFLSRSRQQSELLDLVRIEGFRPGYRIMRMLQYIRESDHDVKLHVYEHRDRQFDHEIALLRLEREGVRVLRADRLPREFAEVLPNPAETLLSADTLQAAREKAAKMPMLLAEIETLNQSVQTAKQREMATDVEEEKREAQQEAMEASAAIEQRRDQMALIEARSPKTEVLQMVDHRPRMLQALAEANERVIIISPWLTTRAVDRELREAIRQTLQRGSAVWIGFGFGSPGEDEEVPLQELQKLQKRFGDRLRLQRLKESHAKVLVCDDQYMITTSFNWLSFAGRSDWGNRIEFGLETGDRSAVRKMVEQLELLFSNPGATPHREKTNDSDETSRTDNKGTTSSAEELLRSLRGDFRLEFEDSNHIALVYVPPGEFLMGSDRRDEDSLDRERPQNRLYLPEYWIGRFPVTQGQYMVFWREVRPKGPRPDTIRGDHPIAGVNWDQAVAYCEWVSRQIAEGKMRLSDRLEVPPALKIVVHLPSEAEWEKAARGVDGRIFPWGNNFRSERLNADRKGICPVGQFSPDGDSPFGCADMVGNVWEWTSSLWRRYPYRSDDGREDSLSRGDRVLRGGSYHNNRARLRCANRVYTQPHKGDDDFGFRIAVKIEPV